MNNYTIDLIYPRTWAIYDGEVRCFLFEGNERALLLDTGFGKIPMDEAAACLTDRPVFVVNTHSHGDHISGDAPFETVYIHPKGLAALRGRGLAVRGGDFFDLGGRRLYAAETPGHSEDGISLIDREARALFTGDILVLRNGTARDIAGYLSSLDMALAAMSEGFIAYSSHGGLTPTQSEVKDLRECLVLIGSGKLTGKPVHLELPPDVRVDTFEFSYKGVIILYDESGKA